MNSSIDKNHDQIIPSSLSSSNLTSSDPWKERILIPTLLAGVTGGSVGLISKHKKALGLSKTVVAYASNFAIVAGCYCGAREFFRVSRSGKPDDLMNSIVGGFGSGAILGRLQGGRAGAVRYSVIFAAVGTAIDHAAVKLKPVMMEFADTKGSWFKIPEWSPIQVLDDEAVAAKQAQKQLRKGVHNLNEEES